MPIGGTRPAAWTTDDISWQEVAAGGTRYAVLEGDRSVGPFSFAFFIPAGFWDPAHWHTADARVFVGSGTLWLGYGERLDRAGLRPYRAGSLVVVPTGLPHVDRSDQECLIYGVANGPWATQYVEPSHTPSAGTPLLRS